MPPPDPLTPTEVYGAIQKILELRDSIGWTEHALQRSSERHFNADDVRRVLVRGTVSPNPEWESTFKNWKYKICGKDYDDSPLAVVIVLDPLIGRLTIITGEDC